MTTSRTFFDSPALKIYAEGTTRTRTPAHTLALIGPALQRFGITRLANVTGLDRLGIPVYQAVRPNARSLSVSQGKGLDEVSAKVSALMESLEAYHAEHARCAIRIASYRELSREVRVADPFQLPLSRASRFHPEVPLPWALGNELVSGEPVYVPYELVHANFTLPRIPGSGAFAASTSGLGSGNHKTEAALHGICELVERDAETLWQLGGEKAIQQTRVDNASVDAPAARGLIDLLRNARIEVLIFDMTSDVGLACFAAFLFDPESDPDLNPYPVVNGSGCHPDKGIALCRALTEAAQSRLTSIAGSRDDITTGGHRAQKLAEGLQEYEALARAPLSRSFDATPHWSGASIDDDLDRVMGCLAERGMTSALVVDLSSPGFDMAFARTLVPGLESSIASPSYLPRARAQQRLA